MIKFKHDNIALVTSLPFCLEQPTSHMKWTYLLRLVYAWTCKEQPRTCEENSSIFKQHIPNLACFGLNKYHNNISEQV